MAAGWTARESTTPSNRRILLLSLVLGLLAAVLLFRVLTVAQPKATVAATVPVLVAKQDIPAKTIVTDSMLTVKQVPAGIRLSTAFTDSKAATGHVARAQINAGEQVLTVKLADSLRDLD